MKCKIIDVIKVEVLNDYLLHVHFDNGCSGVVDISKIIPFQGVFEPLKDKDYFSRASVNPDIGTICWENDADISPGVLFEYIEKNQKDAA